MPSGRNPTKHIWELGQVGMSWDNLGWVENQRNYIILNLKKTSGEERKNEEEYRI